MDFSFTEDQLALRDALSRFLMTEMAPEMLRELWESELGRSPALFRRVAEQGLGGLSVPEACGGLGMGDLDWALMAQELGYYGLPDSVVDTAWLGAGLLAALPEGHAARDWLVRVVDGNCRIAVGHRHNPLVSDAHVADLLLLPENTPAGLVLHAVPGAAVQLQPHRSIDASRRLAELAWSPTMATRIAEGAQAQALWDTLGERGALAASGQMVGLAQRMLDLAVDYAAQRKQFGKPIGSFQAVKHHLADVVTHIEFAKPVLYRAAQALAYGETRLPALVSHAKLACGEAAWMAARKSIQVHGAMGYTWEVDLQMFMKRAWALDAAWGDRAFHRERLAALLLDPDTPLALGPGSTFTTRES
jgi:hypothetical protein